MPVGRRASGEPLGVTFFAGWLSDADLLRWGFAFEQAAGA
jgi:Asp-tRNA(Asn)/Glu-tRNA(Gln) amidotransferase A subunit family amidase